MKGTVAHLKRGFASLFEFKDVKRPVALYGVCAFAIALPILIGQLTGYSAYGSIASMGAVVCLYTPSATLWRRAKTLAFVLLGLTLAFAIGLAGDRGLIESTVSLMLVAFIAVACCQKIRLAPPGSFFFILACCLSKAVPYDPSEFYLRVGLVFVGGLSAAIFLMLFSFLMYWRGTLWQVPSPPVSDEPWTTLLSRAGIVGVAVGGGYWFSSVIGFENPYWVSITCAAIFQGQTMEDFWGRTIHRAFGTAVGMGLAWLIFWPEPPALVLVLILFSLSWTIEVLVAKNYAVACFFITPFTIMLAYFANTKAPAMLIQARMIDVLIGSAIALLFGALLLRLKLMPSHRH